MLAYELTKELRRLEGKNISNGTENVGSCVNVYLFSYTEPNRQGTRTQIESNVTDLIDPNLYYYALFEINAKNGFDFKHDGTKFDTSSVKTIINGVETAVQWDDYYNEYWKCAEFYIPIKISKIAIDDYTATLSATSYTYDGTAKTPEVTVDGLTKDVDYKVTYSNNTNAGTATVTVEGIGNYSGNIEKTFTITKQAYSSKFKTTLSTTNYTYNGSAKKPSVTAYNSAGKKLVNGTDYTVSYASGRTKIGKYKVTVTFKGNYSGSKDLYFEIGPKNPSSVKTTLYGYDDVKVSWSKVSGASGYKVYYKKSSASSWTLLKTTTATSYKKANLSDGVKYVFKVVAYKNVNGNACENAGKTSSIYTLKTVAGVKVAKSGTKVKVSWTNISGETGYQISQSTSKTGTKVVATYATTSGKYKTVSATKGKTYYYKVRAYKTVESTKIYGPWSNVVKYKR